MNLNRQLVLLAICIAASVFFTGMLYGQAGVIPVHAVPYVEAGVQQVQAAGLQSTGRPDFGNRLRLTQFVGERYPLIDSPVDYTPELISTYTPLDGPTARKIGWATVSDNVLGHGKHSPTSPYGIAQASYFQSVAQPQFQIAGQPQFQVVGQPQFQQVIQPQFQAVAQPQFFQTQQASQFPKIFGDASNAISAARIGGVGNLDERPRWFYDQNIGGGRSIFKAFWDKHWTRMVLVYGGFGNSEDNGADIFDGQASTNLGIVGVDIGRRHSRFMRSSIDFTYRGGNVDFQGEDVGQVRAYSLMKNFHLDLKRRGPFRPYIGFGIGGGVLDADAQLGDDTVQVQDEGSFAYQIMGGAAYNISELAALYAEYRYFSLTSLDVASTSGIAEGSFTTHDVLFGLRFGY